MANNSSRFSTAGTGGRRAGGSARHERAIARIARHQHGNITRAQLLGLGLTASDIAYRLKIGRLVRVHTGVYAVAYLPSSPYSRAMAAVLACGDGAVLSHGSALSLWRDEKNWRTPLEVTARSALRRPELRIHRSRTLARRDVTKQYGIPVTSPARTVYDNAARLTDRALARAVNDLRLARYLHLADLDELLRRHPTTRATKRLRPYLAHAKRNPTRSTFEDDFLPFIARYGLPEPLINTRVASHEVDVFFPEHGLVVELDGWEFHRDRGAFERDRRRDADLLERGIATVRLTKDRFDADPAGVAAQLHAILRGRTSWR